jgi:signal transduction histidine kinase
MQRHIERHLTRARLAPPSEDLSTSLRDVAERVAGVVERTPAGGRLNWLITVPPHLTARIDPDDLAEALGNLIDNAARHARSKVSISGAIERDMATLTIFDDGPGIPQAHHEEVWRRGTRLDASGAGSGVGLAIVADIAEACGAALSFDAPDQGFGVTLRIPRGRPREPR